MPMKSRKMHSMPKVRRLLLQSFAYLLLSNGIDYSFAATGTIRLSGPEEIVSSWTRDRCSKTDVPDTAARAFRDFNGDVHLIASNEENRSLVGRSFSALTKHCHSSYLAHRSANPADFDDEGWLESFYTEDGLNIYALVSMDYHPVRHGKPCGTSAQSKEKCWYAAIVAARSTDGGYSFAREPRAFVIGPSTKFDSSVIRSRGAFVPSNIVKFQGYYYVMVSIESLDGKRGECLLRSSNLSQSESWRGWNGSGFTVRFASPYAQNEEIETCSPLPSVKSSPIRSLGRLSDGSFVAIAFDEADGSRVIAQFSSNLVDWSAPTTVANLPMYKPNKGVKGAVAYYYPSLIDPSSPSLNFETVGTHAYLYLTKYTYSRGLNRDLVRFPVNIELH